MRDVIRKGRAGVLIAPSILSADFARMGEECGHVLGECGADLLHLDVMDGHFAPNLTMGPDMCAALRRAFPEASLDVHLMVERPEEFITPFQQAGADNLTFHVERVEGMAARRMAERIRGEGMSAGLAVNPPSRVEPVVEVMDAFDMLLVMSVNPGFSGQRFIPGVLDKAKVLKGKLKAGQRIEIDGGVNLQNAPEVRAAGVDVIVAATAVFGAPKADRAGVVRGLRG